MLTGIKILVAEDNMLNQRVLKYIFQQKNGVVEFVTTGRQAVDKLTAEAYDVVLMDVYMPEMNGLDATREIRQKLNSRIPIIGITAGTFSDEREACLAAGMDICVYKPFDAEALSAHILETIKAKKEA